MQFGSRVCFGTIGTKWLAQLPKRSQLPAPISLGSEHVPAFILSRLDYWPEKFIEINLETTSPKLSVDQ